MNTLTRYTNIQTLQRVCTSIVLGVALSLALSSTTLADSAATKVYNIADDFNYPNNPNGVWSYGWKTNVGSEPIGEFNLLPTLPDAHDVFSSEGEGQIWLNQQEAIADEIPLNWVSINTSNGGAGGPSSVVRFTAPRGGKVKVYGTFGLGRGDCFRGVYVNNVKAWESAGYGLGGHFNFSINVKAGDFIDFVTWDSRGYGGNTPVNATVTYQQ